MLRGRRRVELERFVALRSHYLYESAFTRAPEILDRAGLRLESRLRRDVNRRTGRRAGEYFEDVPVARPA